MAKKQKVKNKKDEHDLIDESLDQEIGTDEAESLEDQTDSSVKETEELSSEEKVKDLEEALLRSRAELDNAFKRNAADIEKAHKYGVERLLNELLPVVDNLEHALNNFSKDSTKEDKEELNSHLNLLNRPLINSVLDPSIQLMSNLIQLSMRL